ncbi:Probable transcriptional regulatory protein NarL [Pseudomonas putida]|nr:Probable transcriptional regulatory protein NarL [Pseudomonas putida]CAB5529707.1 Probable transcriptional regulatory protein NarL [Pseudomonas putida]CAB5570562.1 Probable transcriptional regulatory protein NarL [Pseudomonas putida]CAB5571867.1 Probable transcriptional regulatory protein NarL [Pseudomonas putida]CAB5654023.1 Probable transcriptional regulatory protein NarL [Pseudomonas putida]
MTTATSITANGWTGFLGRELSLREVQCVLGIACGQTSKELARELGVQPDSIKKRVLSATTKLGVTRRAQLVAVAMQKGLISPVATALALVLVIHGLMADDVALRVRRGSGEKRVELRVAARRVEQFQVAA